MPIVETRRRRRGRHGGRVLHHGEQHDDPRVRDQPLRHGRRPADDPGGAGIVIQGAGGNVLERNFIGTDITGTLARPNRSDAVFIDNSPNNRIGGTTLDARNLLSGNCTLGHRAERRPGRPARSSRATGSARISTGQLPLPNGAGGLFVQGSASTIGAGAGSNVIAFNGGPGIAIAAGLAHRISSNSIHSNGGLGIDLGNNGVTPNDAGDGDAARTRCRTSRC